MVYFTERQRVCRGCGRVDERTEKRGVKRYAKSVMENIKKQRQRGAFHSNSKKRALSPIIEQLLWIK